MFPRRHTLASRAVLALTLTMGLAAASTAPSLASPPRATRAPLTEPVDLALWNTGPTERYRIPALTTAPNGDLLSFFDARPSMNDVPSPISLVMRRSTDGGRTWLPLETIRTTDGKLGYGDPSVLVDRETGRIMVFYAASINAGYASSRPGNDPADPNILHVDVSTSDDNGRTWQHRRVTPEVKDAAWGGIFAASGEGIQLRHGKYAGRLVQQFVVRSGGQNWAMSAYSDDHGATWQRGSLTGPGMDENKTVELADGRVLLNVRAGGARRQAISTDGGVTYGPLTTEPQQVDPGSNGAVTRVFPDAPAHDPRAQLVLLTNDEDPGIRRNTTAKLSCDSGKTWPGRVVIDEGASAYITATPLGGGRMGLLYERDGYAKITYRELDVNRMGHQCAPISVAESPALTEGSTTPVTFVLTNQERRAIPPGQLRVSGPEGWPDTVARVPTIPPGQTRQVTAQVAAPAGAAGSRALRATYTSKRGESTMHLPVEVSRGAGQPDRPALRLEPYIDAVYTGGARGLVGDLAVPWVRVTNTGNTTLTGIRVTSSTGEPGCTVATLEPGHDTVCRDRRQLGRTLTDADIAAGTWAPVYSATTSGPTAVTARAALDPLDLRVPQG